MADFQATSRSVCDTCVEDARDCIAEGWHLTDGTNGRFGLYFRCRRLDLALEAEHGGRGTWHVVDHRHAPGGVDVAAGRTSDIATVMYHAADAFHGLGYFQPLDREAIAASLQRVYADRVTTAQPRRRGARPVHGTAG